MNPFYDKLVFHVRNRIFGLCINKCRIAYYKLLGMNISWNSSIGNVRFNWPHQIYIGNFSIIEEYTFLKFDGIWRKGPGIIIGNHVFIGSGVEFNIKEKIIIGDNTLIGSGSKFIDHDHGIVIGMLIKDQPGPIAPIIIGSDVWIGDNVVILKGVTIHDGAIVAAGAVVSKDIPSNEIWGGIPAKMIKKRV